MFLNFLNLPKQVAGKYEGVQFLICTSHDFLLSTLPLLSAVANEDYILANTHYGVHIMSIYNCGHFIFNGNIMNELIYYKTRFGVQTRVWLITEQILWIKGYSTRNGNALLHSATYLSREFIFRPLKIYTFQTEFCTPYAIGLIII